MAFSAANLSRQGCILARMESLEERCCLKVPNKRPNNRFQSDSLAAAILSIRSVLTAFPIYQTDLLHGCG
jgi:hypothetical protein